MIDFSLTMKQELAALLFLIPVITASCPNGAVEYQSNCYFFNSTSTGFASAEISCNGLGGNLASVHDAFTNVMLGEEAQNNFHGSTDTDFWIGGNNLLLNGIWNWTDGSTFDFKDWKKGEPQNVTGSNCASLSMADGLWTANNCFLAKPFVCEIPAHSYPLNANCSVGWSYFAPTGSCYGVGVGGYLGNWTAAETYCQKLGAHLPSIRSYAESQYLASYVFEAWNGIWTGIFSPDGGRTWITSDGTPADFLKYKNWCLNNALNVTGERCVAIEVSGSSDCYWNDDCVSAEDKTLCKKPLF